MRHHRLSRTVAAVLTVLGMSLSIVPAQAQSTEITCRDLMLPVSLVGLPQTVYGRLCVPTGARTVQLLVPGASYNSTYWDFPYTPQVRSFRLAMNKAGYATLAIDRLGSGRSSHPVSATLTSFTQATVVHQLVQALRAGSGTPRFDRVILGGHSVGSAIAMIEAGTYHDVDGVLITGLTHGMNVLGSLPILTSLVPAPTDPKFANRGYGPGYFTTAPGTRYDSFHKPGASIKGVDDTDEATKDTFAPGEVVDTVLLGMIVPYSKAITVPVLLAMGNDPAYCGSLTAPDCSSASTLLADEAPDYSPAAHLRTFVLHDFGHAINLAPDAPRYYAAVVRWANEMVGR